MKDKKRSVLTQGPIKPGFITEVIRKHESKTALGAHQIFLGQVRADSVDDKHVSFIDYSAYTEMAEQEFARIREEAFEKFKLSCLHIYHSVGKVKTGQISLFVMLSASHRQNTSEACRTIVEQIKKRVPIWKQECFEDGSSRWATKTDKADEADKAEESKLEHA